MQYISATEAKQSFAATMDKARNEPIVIQRQNRDTVAMVSMQDFEFVRQGKAKQLKDIMDKMGQYAKDQGLTETKLNEILDEINS